MDKISVSLKQDAEILRFLQHAADRSRIGLSGISVQNGDAVSSDGYRMHLTPLPTVLSGFKPGTVLKIRNGKIIHKSPGKDYEYEVVGHNYPNLRFANPMLNGSLMPYVNLNLRPKFLAGLLDMPLSGDTIPLRIYVNGPIVARDKVTACSAVIYPVLTDDDRKHNANFIPDNTILDILKKESTALYNTVLEVVAKYQDL